MTIVDGIVLGITLISAILGFFKGFTREILSLASWSCSGILTVLGIPYVKNIAKIYIQNDMIAQIAALLSLFIVFLIIFSLLSHVLSRFVKDSVLGGIDRALGFMYGIARGFCVLCITQGIIQLFMQDIPTSITNNRFFPYIHKGGDFFAQSLPMIIHSKWLSHVIPDDIMKKQLSADDKTAIAIVSDHLHPPHNEPQNTPVQAPPFPAENIAPQQPEDYVRKQQIQAEQLARLQPKIEVIDNKGVTRRQQKALDRFLETTPDDTFGEDTSLEN